MTGTMAAFSMARFPTTLVPTSMPFAAGGASALASWPTRIPSPTNLAALSSTRLGALSPASSLGLLLRGGGSIAEDVVLKSFYGDALGFFGGVRIPASFLAGSSLGAIFLLKNKAFHLSSAEGGSMSKLERRVIKVYHLVSVLAFVLSLNTIAMTTMACTAIHHGRFNPMAETSYMLMKREFEYEFVMTRWSFLTSIFCFLGMLTSRILIEFDLLKKDGDGKGKKKDVAMLVVCSLGALATNLLSYVNDNLYCWKSLMGMTIHLAKLVYRRAFLEARPLSIISVMCTMVSIFYVGKLVLDDFEESA